MRTPYFERDSRRPRIQRPFNEPPSRSLANSLLHGGLSERFGGIGPTFKPKKDANAAHRDSHPGLSAVFAAAVVNKKFRELLLNDPEKALKQGYLGKSFALNQEDSNLIISLDARSLVHIAKLVVGIRNLDK
jgi:hypothetical protein